MRKKRLFKALLGMTLAASATLALASCKNSTETRNTVTPYGDLYSNLDNKFLILSGVALTTSVEP